MAGGGLSLNHRTRLCYLLFSTFIALDVYVSGSTVLLLTRSDTGFRTNITDDDVTPRQGRTNHSLPVKDMPNHNEKSFPTKLKDPTFLFFDVFAEFTGFAVFLILNVVALVGLRKSKAQLLLPWIIVYLISISASYINFSFLLITHLLSNGLNNWKIFLPLATAIVFHMGWILVKSVFEDFKKQMQRSEQSEISQVGNVTTSNL